MIRTLFIVVGWLIVSASWAAEPRTEVFGDTKLWTIHITMTAAEYDGMQPTNAARFPGFGPPQPPIPKVAPKAGDREVHRNVFGVDLPLAYGSISINGQKFEKVGLRYKGNGTYLESARFLKRSVKVDLNKFDDNARFEGLKTLNLHSGITDPSKGRESLAYAMYRLGGVPAPLTAFADVSLTVAGKYDNELLGLFTVVEQVDKPFLKTHFKNGDGLVLKPERMRTLEYLGDNWDAYKANYQPKREATPDEAKRVIGFTRLVNRGSDDEFAKEIGNYLDIEHFLRFMACTAYVVNLDSFFSIGHNYLLYLHPETNRFSFIPWDVDRAIANFPIFGNAEQQMDLNVMHPYPGECRLPDRLLAIKEHRERYQAILKELATTVFKKQRLHERIDVIEKVLKTSIEKDTKAGTQRRETGGFNAFFGKPPELHTFVDKRTESVEAQLAGRSKGYTPQSFGFGPPQPQGPAVPLARGLLESLDDNKDGKVSEAEFESGMKKLFQQWDRNKSGTLDINKLADGLQKLLPPAPMGGFPPKK